MKKLAFAVVPAMLSLYYVMTRYRLQEYWVDAHDL